MLIVYIVRAAILITFLMMAAGGPYAIWQLRLFIKRYGIAHKELQDQLEALDKRVEALEKK